MRTRYIVLSVLALLFVGCGSDEGSQSLSTTPPAVKLYKTANARIEYEYSGAATGSKVHIIGNYGMYQRMEDELNLTMEGKTRNVHVLDIINDTVQYHVELAEMTGTRQRFESGNLVQMTKEYTEADLEDFQQSYLLKSGAVKKGTETILDRECTVYEIPNAGISVSLWNSLTLRTRIKMGESEIVMTAVKVDEDYSPSMEDFLPPKKAKIEPPRVISSFPEGHPPVDGMGDQSGSQQLPEGHPPVQGGSTQQGGAMPEGHPPVQGGQ